MKRNMKLGTKIAFGFAGVLLLMLIMIAISIYNLSSIHTMVKTVVRENFTRIELIHGLKENFVEINLQLAELVLNTDETQLQKELKELNQVRENYNKVYNDLKASRVATERERAFRDKVEEMVETAIPINEQMIKLAMANKKSEAIEVLLNKASPATQAAVTAADEYLIGFQKYNDKQVAAGTTTFSNTLIVMLSLGIIAIIFGILITVFITRGISNSINRIADSLTEGSNQVAAASNQLSSSSQQLAEGSAEQSSSLEETSSTLEETTSMIQQISENTKQAALLSEQTKESSDKGNVEMQEMTESMNEIKKSSDQISKVIKVIDDIAFQTNILALNAAVEAARAGEAGMGFAVVAEEVRNLAQRSAQAAKDTAGMIENNIELSEKGVNVTQKIKETLGGISVQAKKMSDLMAEIAASSQEQSQGISQINKAIAQMETVVQQNAANAEESASASEELSAQARNLKEMVQQLVILVHGKVDQEHEDLLNREHTTHQIKQVTPVLHSGGAGKQVPQLQGPETHSPEKRTKLVSPEEVIPLDKDKKGF